MLYTMLKIFIYDIYKVIVMYINNKYIVNKY